MDKVLYTTPVLEYPAVGGPQLRIQNSIKALHGICELHVICRNTFEGIGGEATELFYKSYCEQFLYAPSARSNMGYLNKIVRKIDKNYHLDAKFIVDYAQKNNINIIWFGYGNISHKLMLNIKKMNSELKLVCDTDSVWSRFVLRELPCIKDQKRRSLILSEGLEKIKEEASWVEYCNITTAVSEIDAEYYRSLCSLPQKIKVFSNVVDLDYYHQVDRPKDFITPNIYLAGTFWPDSPMEIAARWVINDVLPIIKRKIPTIHFYILGNGSNHILNDINDRDINILGRVESVLPYLSNSDVAIVPLKFESGTRFKILEAGACSVPIVSTTLGAEGIPVTNGKDILLADEPVQFAEAIIRVIEDKQLREKLVENCRKLVQDNYSINKLQEEGRAIIYDLKQ